MMRKQLVSVLILFIILPLFPQEGKSRDVWKTFRVLEGHWEGEGEGKSGHSKLTCDFQFILNEKFLQMKTRAVFEPQEKNQEGEVHEDLGIFSYDQIRKKVVFRQFHVEGFVNQYVLENREEDDKIFTFLSEKIENGPPGLKAKLVFKILDNDSLETSFYLALPEKGFDCHSVNTLSK